MERKWEKGLTFAFKPLPEESVEERSAVIAERRWHIIMHTESVWNVDFKTLSQILEKAIEVIMKWIPICCGIVEENEFILLIDRTTGWSESK